MPSKFLCLAITLLATALGQILGFDARDASIETVHQSLFTGASTCRNVVSAFLARIERYNSRINALISLNPSSLAVADSLDELLAMGNATGALFCIPVILKDNYDMAGTNTTGGCLALRNLKALEDAPSVAALKRAGAVILGKANLHELALEGLSVSSLGGQTVNPYDWTRTPGGSSGGTAAAIAASFAILGLGTGWLLARLLTLHAHMTASTKPFQSTIQCCSHIE
jgi:Asp-tRNA(Asn)/Glu-tRNA(Gln) amidotransferase A subunit family amidase